MKLIIHCGFGKTGTTSIQKTLRLNDKLLINKGYFYCGMSFDRLAIDKEWKKTPWGFNSLSNECFIQEYLECWNLYSKEAKRLGCHTLILSNEGFSDQVDKICLFSKVIISQGFEVELIFYTRHPVKWLVSAYQQWGIKHKSNVGEIMTINDFYATGKHYRFKEAIKSIELHEMTALTKFKKLENALNKDVSVDFLNEIGIEHNAFEIVRDNEKLSTVDESIYFANNSLFSDVCLPTNTSNLLSRYNKQNINAEKYLSRYDLNDAYLKELDDYLMELKGLSRGEIDYSPENYIISSDNVDVYLFNMMRVLCEIERHKDVDALRDAAIKLEKNDINLSVKLMKLASILRPDGPYIQEKLTEYELKV
ncbi:hypothetical protein [Enterovibrio norvegicus]|uniref:hypothetical protein n=1 Tax=Enterovibrio norvegicus TaxID=188144 RepID=UPI00352E884E